MKALIKVLAVAIFFCSSPVSGQDVDVETASLDKEMIHRFLVEEAQRVTEYAKSRIAGREMLEANRESLHREFMYMIGLDPLPPRTPLHLSHVRTIERASYTVVQALYRKP